MPTLSDCLAQTLTDAGVKVIFGLPGGENVEALDALRKRGVQFVLVRNESTAVFMADVQARLTGGIGVALTTLGPGAVNACAGIAHAWLDRAPVLLLTAETDPRLSGLHTHQVLDLQAIFKPVTKLSASLRPENAGQILPQALALLRAGRPGPVHLSLPAVYANQPIQEAPRLAPAAPAAPADSRQLAKARSLLAASRRPVIVAGLGLEPDRPYAQLHALAEAFHAPVIDTPKSKGVLPSDHPLFAGTIGLTMTDPAYEILDASDCILAVGFDVVELVKPWIQPQPLIWISNWRNDDPPIDAQCELIGGLPSILGDLLAAPAAADAAWGEGRVSAWRASQRSRPKPAPAPNRISPADALASIRANTPPGTIVTTDVGSHKIFTSLNWPALEPNTFHVSNGLSVMGFGLAAALAAARATRRPVVCITGDGGLAMVQGELSLARELDLPLIVVVMNDAALDLIRAAQTRRELPVFGTEFLNPDYEMIARGYGLAYARVNNRADCDTAVAGAAAAGKPALLEVMVDAKGYRQ
jgi:acetolactate synthase-1/2/3 large subunit